MRAEFINEYNELVRKHKVNSQRIKDEKEKHMEKDVLGLNEDELNQDVHYIAISILEENTSKKIFRLEKDRTAAGTMLFVRGNKVLYRPYQHKNKHEVSWTGMYLPDKTILDVMPYSFIDMANAVEKVKNEYNEHIGKTFFEGEKAHYWGRRDKKPQEIYHKDLDIRVFQKHERYGEATEMRERIITSVSVEAFIENDYDKKLNFKVKVFAADENANNEDKSVMIEHDAFPILTNDELTEEILQALTSAENYCQKWLDKRAQVRKKVDETIEKYGYLETLGVSRL